MKPRRAVTPEDAADMFDEAVRERALTVLTLRVGDDWQSMKCRFLERDPNRRFFVLDYQSVDGVPLPELGPGQCVGVSFRNRSRKILFASVVEARGHYLFDDRSSIPAIRYRWPDSITELQRRSYYRTHIPEAMSLNASLWPGGIGARSTTQMETLSVIAGTLVDVSCGGALVRLPQAAAPTWTDGETLGAEINLGDGKPPVVSDVRFRGVRHDQDGQMMAGLQFIGLELTVDGRLVLQRLASCVQRFHRHTYDSGQQKWPSQSE